MFLKKNPEIKFSWKKNVTKKMFSEKNVPQKNLPEKNLRKIGPQGPHRLQPKAAALRRSYRKAARRAAIFSSTF